MYVLYVCMYVCMYITCAYLQELWYMYIAAISDLL